VDGSKIDGSIGRLSFPKSDEADEQAAFQIQLSTDGATAVIDSIVTRRADVVMLMSYGDLYSIDSTDVQPFVDLALAKLPK
jgi:hypothetical protein